MKYAFLLLILSVSLFACRKPNTVSLAELTLKPEPSKETLFRQSAPRTIDWGHLDLELTPDWKTKQVNATATWDGRVYYYPVNEIILDAKGMKIHSTELRINGEWQNVKNNYDFYKLRIPLPKELLANDSVFLRINYTARPHELAKYCPTLDPYSRGLHFISPGKYSPKKPIQIWTQNEPEDASVWIPVNDAPNEKITHELKVTVPKDFITLSNGIKTASEENSNGSRTDTWRMDLPHAPYLVMLAAGEFHVTTEFWNGKEVSYYVEPAFAPYAGEIYPNTVPMLEYFSNLLGTPYPWQKYSQIIVRDYTSGAMENTTAVVFGEFIQRIPAELAIENYESIVAHEMFHHWFGDLVTCESWIHLAVNESFANYSEYLWFNHKYGEDEALAHHFEERQGYFAEAQGGKKEPVVRHHYFSKEDMFDAHSYNKGGQILHMLKNEMGDSAFFHSLRYYLKSRAFNAAEIHHLRLAMEEVTGRDWYGFFNQWFLKEGHPVLEVKHKYLEDKQLIELVINQIQEENHTYRIPLSVLARGNTQSGKYNVTLRNRTDTFLLRFPENPWIVLPDPEFNILAEWKQEFSSNALFRMYQHVPGYMARRHALKFMAEQFPQSDALQSLALLALKDPHHSLRIEAMELLCNENGKTKTASCNLIEERFNEDKNPKVRYEALEILAMCCPGQALSVLKKTINDPLPPIRAQALEYLFEISKSEAIKHIPAFLNDTTPSVVAALAPILAELGSVEYKNWFLKSYDYITDNYDEYQFITSFGKWLGKQEPGSWAPLLDFFTEVLENDPMYVARFGAYNAMLELLDLADKKGNDPVQYLLVTTVQRFALAERHPEMLSFLGIPAIPDPE
jgi:aminopeptidase N